MNKILKTRINDEKALLLEHFESKPIFPPGDPASPLGKEALQEQGLEMLFNQLKNLNYINEMVNIKKLDESDSYVYGLSKVKLVTRMAFLSENELEELITRAFEDGVKSAQQNG